MRNPSTRRWWIRGAALVVLAAAVWVMRLTWLAPEPVAVEVATATA